MTVEGAKEFEAHLASPHRSRGCRQRPSRQLAAPYARGESHMREALVTNSVMSASAVTAMKANITAFFSTLKFP